ncbi:MAG: flagellar FliJ family protein [Minwuia sp.]|uniref:flagellar FliJ family protein n=1 Tax=Minwuia sp. TaxID=2493630 RepID=UPI003A89B819
MKTLERLIGIAQLNLDQARQVLMDLEAVRDDLANRILMIDREIAGEMEAAQRDPMLTQSLGHFIKSARDRQTRLRTSIAELDQQIEAAREKVSDAFRERKRYEKVLETRRAEQKRRRDRREQEQMDEIGMRNAREASA